MDIGVPKALLPTFKKEFQVWTQVSLVNENLHVFPHNIFRRQINRGVVYIPFIYGPCKVYLHKESPTHFKIQSIRYESNKDWGY